jgi:predicted nucleic acid-binding protein
LLVLDTNVVLDLLHFDDPSVQSLKRAVEAGHVGCVVTDATLDEWRRVLGYPEFRLDAVQQAALFARYQALATKSDKREEAFEVPRKATPIRDGLESGRSRMPRCSDPDDQKFVDLAAASGAQGLVSKDRAVLKLRRRCASRFRIMTPVEAVRWIGESVPE